MLLGWALLLITGGSIAYWRTHIALTREFDDTLRAKVLALAALTEQRSGRIELELGDQIAREYDADSSTTFFQIWSADGKVAWRSKSLRGGNLPLPIEVRLSPSFWYIELPTGRSGRAVGLKYRPQMSDEAQSSAASVDAFLVVATDRHELDRTLAKLRWVLGGCGALMLVLTAATVPILVRFELAPLADLADQTQRITPYSLNVRVSTDGMPGELVPIGARLNDLLQRLQTGFEKERQFSDNLAHEFRTPIAELRSLAELAIKWPDTRDSGTDQNILHIALRMESLINRLLAIVRGEQGQVPVSPERVNMAVLVAAVCEPYRTKAMERSLTLATNIPDSLVITSNPVLLRSIVTNLVDNAVEYAPSGATVRIQSEAQQGRFTLKVVNPAEQLNAEDAARLFDRLWRKDPARSHSEHAGLGLALARAFAASLDYTLNAAVIDDACLAVTLEGPVNMGFVSLSISHTEKQINKTSIP